MNISAFSIKEGPTESGIPIPPPNNLHVTPSPVGGEIVPLNLIQIIPKHWIIMLILLLPAALVLYKKREVAIELITRILLNF